MKLSVSLPDEDVNFVDEYANRTGAVSRSSVMHRAIGLLRMADLESAYSAAWEEWATSENPSLWDETTGDGIADAAR
jgi:Arc/MetJ-type ribon-helix-helix transcriptional regulator